MAIEIESAPNALTGGKPLVLTGEGAFDFKKKVGSMTIDMSALGLPGASGKVPMVLDGEVFYIKLPSVFGLGPKPWLKVDLSTLGDQAGLDLSGLQQVGGSDPTSALNYLQGVSEDGITKVGDEKIRGVDTTHYKATIDLEKAKAQVDESLHDDYDKIIEQLGRSTFPADVWVDGDNLVRKMRVSLRPASEQNDAAPVTITQELYDFGTDVEVEVPPADQVGEFSSLLSGLAGG
jgi:hypothetical protein